MGEGTADVALVARIEERQIFLLREMDRLNNEMALLRKQLIENDEKMDKLGKQIAGVSGGGRFILAVIMAGAGIAGIGTFLWNLIVTSSRAG